jgi:hypothetical protein
VRLPDEPAAPYLLHHLDDMALQCRTTDKPGCPKGKNGYGLQPKYRTISPVTIHFWPACSGYMSLHKRRAS